MSHKAVFLNSVSVQPSKASGFLCVTSQEMSSWDASTYTQETVCRRAESRLCGVLYVWDESAFGWWLLLPFTGAEQQHHINCNSVRVWKAETELQTRNSNLISCVSNIKRTSDKTRGWSEMRCCLLHTVRSHMLPLNRNIKVLEWGEVRHSVTSVTPGPVKSHGSSSSS